MSGTSVRVSKIQTGETFINLNDLIISLMMKANQSTHPHEADTIKKIVEYLVSQREKAHVSH